MKVFRKTVYCLLLILLANKCKASKQNNPCDPTSKSIIDTLVVKAIIKDETPHCGYTQSIEQSEIDVCSLDRSIIIQEKNSSDFLAELTN